MPLHCRPGKGGYAATQPPCQGPIALAIAIAITITKGSKVAPLGL